MANVGEDGGRSPRVEGGDEKVRTETPHGVISVEHDSEKGGSEGAREQYTQIDPAIANRIAANVDDFMVRLLSSWGGLR